MKLFRKREIWLPTWPTLLILVFLIGGLGFLTVRHLYPFLAQSDPIENAEMLIIEGWMADAEIQEAAKAIQPGQTVVVTGGPVSFGRKILHYDNYADLGAARLIEYGIPAENIVIAPAPDTQRDRTYVSALAARAKLEEVGLFGKSANLYTIGAHARRSHMLFHKVFGKNYPLGVIAVEPPQYNLKHWYLYSEGFKHVITEFVSWMYAKIFLLAHV